MRNPSIEPTRISLKWLRKNLECSPEGQTESCLGKCCRGAGIWAQYSNKEYLRLPDYIKENLVQDPPHAWRVRKMPGRCYFLSDTSCALEPEHRPFLCNLFPLVVNEKGTIVLHRWGPLACPNWGKGRPLYLSFKRDLIRCLGEINYYRIYKAIESGLDIVLDLKPIP